MTCITLHRVRQRVNPDGARPAPTPNKRRHPPANCPGVLHYKVLLVMVMAVTMPVIIVVVAYFLDNCRFGG